MANYQHQEGKGRLFRTKDKKSEKHPDFSGNAMWKGEVIQISGWAQLTDGKLSAISIQIQEPRNREESPPKQTNEDDSWGI
jgi:hypothetical protein